MKRLPTLIVSALAALALNATPAVAHSLSEDTDSLPSMTGQPAGQVIMADHRGQGRVIEAFGDIDHADHVVVLVPGVGWNAAALLDESEATRRHPAVQARGILAEARKLDPHSRTAVVVWLDYDAPSTVDLDAAESTRAIQGAPRLAAFVNMEAKRADVSVVCHSYGAVVCAHAASRMNARDIVAVGAPGMDVSTVGQLHSRGRVWAGTAPDDPISMVPHTTIGDLGHGADPTDPGFGARHLPTGTSHGHNGYFTPGTLSLVNIARIALGRFDLVGDR
ncbi:alpha/beta hydrolase [Oryzihumus leptocrescens]|uniref:Alpha/beta hydrolase family protein n=1 Tax=Oryzihumus leptocrescens TaxID=297536 RepID=A0A542ZEE2_9MICO|nr:alpha/beta hydrolase [Oryzihumus leptocrescens]TQL58698.1 alpha/beta hydrolase family protein [Oryzihumus leptocrescens]